MDFVTLLIWIITISLLLIIGKRSGVILWLVYHTGLATPDLLENPFYYDNRLPIKTSITDQKKRDQVLQQCFEIEKVQKGFDSIVIGSGIGGLSVAAILSKVGKKVLVLEQHDKAGGSCHSFLEGGYEFDVGFLYMEGMTYQSLTKTYMDQISDGQIQWQKLDDEFDEIIFKIDGKEQKKYSIIRNVQKQKWNLKLRFPKEYKAIDKYYDLVHDIRQKYNEAMYVKVMQLWFVKLLEYFCIIDWFTNFYIWSKRTVKEVVNELTNNQTLRDIFSYGFLSYGAIPSEAGFPLQALFTSHLAEGAAYPVGGSSEFACRIIPVIERAGGQILVRAEVMKILTGSNGEAIGVEVQQGNRAHKILAPIIISDAGVHSTFTTLLPREISEKSSFNSLLEDKDKWATISIYVGLNASANYLEVTKKRNYWVFLENDIDKATQKYLQQTREEWEKAVSPLIFITFPSIKDRSWETRYAGKTTMVIVIPVKYEWLEAYENKPCQESDESYHALKSSLGMKHVEVACDLFPKIKNYVDYVTIGCPLTRRQFLKSPKSESYDQVPSNNRSTIMKNVLPQSKTDISGLYLTGHDIANRIFMEALWGGLYCAQHVLERNVISDLTSFHKELLKKESKKLY